MVLFAILVHLLLDIWPFVKQRARIFCPPCWQNVTIIAAKPYKVKVLRDFAHWKMDKKSCESIAMVQKSLRLPEAFIV